MQPIRLPALFASSRPATAARRMTQLLVGLFCYGMAIALMMQATIGIEPWDVLAQGITLHTGIPFGLVTNLVGGVVLLFWIPLRQRPGRGTVLNVLLIGPSAQFGLWIVPQPGELWARILLFAAGLLLIAAASGLYIGAHYGPGPRDGLMTGLHARTGRPIWLVRGAIEATVLLIGWLLGGNVGWGTLAFAVCIGPLVHVAIPLFALRVEDAPNSRRESDHRRPRVEPVETPPAR
ncbi:YczE/YyaS/YitT family protein [Humibacter albus]|uniref:membrane protein YczE n=1 Tax=Humibacter albus TaxID=427754 RepID=UPI0003B7AF93|nr:membrane protein [Humibacter albus]